MNETIIRTAREADFDDVTTLYEEFHAFHVRGVPAWLRLPESSDEPAKCEGERAQIRAQLGMIVRDTSAALLLAEASGQIVGLAEVYLRRDEPHPLTLHYTYGYLQSLMVTERWRGRGVGGQLTTAAGSMGARARGDATAAEHVGVRGWPGALLRDARLPDDEARTRETAGVKIYESMRSCAVLSSTRTTQSGGRDDGFHRHDHPARGPS